MYFRRTKIVFTLLVSLLLASCNQAMIGGSLSSPFKGLNSALVLGPTTVQLNWSNVSKCNTYEVHLFSAGSTSASLLGTTSVSPFTVRTPTLQPDQSYTFSLGCVQDNKTAGTDITKSVTTWNRFDGLVSSSIDSTGTKPAVVLNWSYSHPGVTYLVYAKVSSVPGDLASWTLDQSGENGKPQGLTPLCTVFNENTVRIGAGANDCSSASLQTGMIYNFKVVALYPDGNYAVDYTGNGTSILIPSSFTPPDCKLTASGLGPDALHSYLYLRCTAAGNLVGDCPSGEVTARVYQAINGTRTAISEEKNVNAGLITVEPKLTANDPNDRSLDSVEVEYSCNDAGATLKSIVRYDGSDTARAKPTLKYANSYVDKVSGEAAGVSPGYMGGSPTVGATDAGRMTVGDFDCDGKPDLAVGLPYVSYTKAPYFSQRPSTGLVKVYYDYTSAPATQDANVQYLSFRDLPGSALFGASLSSGNINRDVKRDVDTNAYYSCDDLIVGAPGIGKAFIYYGNRQRFQLPLDMASLPLNTSTCSGNVDNSSCSVVKLSSNDNAEFKLINSSDPSQSAFGEAVAYVGDYNADGYGDVVIGAPSSSWDGYSVGGDGTLPSPTGPKPQVMAEVGAIYVFFGGKNGLQKVNVGQTAKGSLSVSYVKAFPPIPQAGMRFGSSISGGGDIDGKLPVPVVMDNENHIILAEGSDFVVGAPGFKYMNTSMGKALTSSTWDWKLDTFGDIVDPVVSTPSTNAQAATPNNVTDKTTAPLNGAWAQAQWTNNAAIPMPTGPLASSTGIAFAYLGRAPWKSYQVVLKNAASDIQKRPIDAKFNNTSNADLYDPQTGKMNIGLRNYQTGSKVMKFNGTIDYTVSPRESFYNCGPRGSPVDAMASTVLHNSCLAGRNNFRVIYPQLKTSDSAVAEFGKKLAVLGSHEVNAVALFWMISENYSYNFDQPTETLSTFKQGNAHFRIRGQNSWEAAINGLGSYAATDSTQYCNDYGDSSCKVSANTASSVFNVGRSPLKETYSEWYDGGNTGTSVSGSSVILTGDLNTDGYADVVVASSGDLWTYYGNYAADFSFSDTINSGANRYSTSASCTVTRNSSVNFGAALPNQAAQSVPFKTYAVTVPTARDEQTGLVRFNKITAEYPYFPIPSNGGYSGFRYLGDYAAQSFDTIMSYTAPSRPAVGAPYNTGAAACIPQRKTATGITSISIADMNLDGAKDLFTGYDSANSNQGKGVLSLSGGDGGVAGFSTDVPFTEGTTTGGSSTTSPSRGGQAVLASDWKTMTFTNGIETESERRDLLLGAPGQKIYTDITGDAAVCANTVGQNPVPSAGMIHHYAAKDMNAISTNRAPAAQNTCFYDTNNAPYNLAMETSKAIGDINGDGYTDIVNPVKRYDNSGGEYYDLVISFGSPFGAVTTSFCLNKLSHIFEDVNETNAISASSCEATVTDSKAFIGGAQVHLPQLVKKPFSVHTGWALSAQAAGDVNYDGKDDIFFADQNGLALFFGSDYGLVTGEPTSGLSSNLAPQKVSTTFSGINAAALNSLRSVLNYVPGGGDYGIGTLYRPAIVHGDFNGDHYEDIAFQVSSYSPTPGTNSATPTGVPWNCNANDSSETCKYAGTNTAVDPGPQIPETSVLVIYGGPTGYQVPSGDFAAPTGEICSDFYENCTQTTSGTYKQVYKSLTVNNGSVDIDANATACDSGGTCTSLSWIRNPMFYNQEGSYALLSNYFGTALTVSDTNNDGIDDLVIGAPGFSHTHAAENNYYFSGVLSETGTSTDKTQKGSAFIYYGSKNYGIVAPSAKSYMGDKSLGLYDGASAYVTFRIYPRFSGSVSSAPSLDVASGTYDEAHRLFGAALTSGDFDGDGVQDIAVASGRGHLYVYYGPICGADNGYGGSSTATPFVTLYNNGFSGNPSYGMYNNPNKPTKINAAHSGNCKVLNLSSGLTTISPSPSNISKSLLPQMVTIPNTTRTQGLGMTLISDRKKGDMNGSEAPTKKSDIVIGGAYAIDANVTTTSNTGLGYVLFGSTEGIYVSTPNYNSSVIEGTDRNGSAKFYSTTLTLKPYKEDGSMVGFFYYPSSAGDFNGDGRMDLLLPTKNVNETNNTDRRALDAGGFVVIH